MLTEAVTRVGHAVVSGIFRFDVNKLVPAGGETAQTAALFAWGRLCIANVERLVAWFIIWPVAHFAMIGVLLALGFKRGPVYVVVPVELIPGGMLSLSLPRAGLTFHRTERVSAALDAARTQQGQPPQWAERLDWRYRVLRGSDWEIAFLAVVALLLIVLSR
ncbi:MAG TPA: hypothetical protein VER07_06125 [Candidatus Polarisedimenticolia bacterium]|nr:hypothetical protein [Candidatus Polarisedimenticolia bacterium]